MNLRLSGCESAELIFYMY